MSLPAFRKMLSLVANALAHDAAKSVTVMAGSGTTNPRRMFWEARMISDPTRHEHVHRRGAPLSNRFALPILADHGAHAVHGQGAVAPHLPRCRLLDRPKGVRRPGRQGPRRPTTARESMCDVKLCVRA